jgi:hypothetical protein
MAAPNVIAVRAFIAASQILSRTLGSEVLFHELNA